MKIEDYQLLTLSALVRSNSLRQNLAHKLRPDMFDDDKHTFLAEILPQVSSLSELAEKVTPIGGVAYLGYLKAMIDRFGKPTTREVREWVERLNNYAQRKAATSLLDFTREELDRLDYESSADALLANLTTGLVDELTNTRTSKGFKTFNEIGEDAIYELFMLSKGVATNRVPTGFAGLDKFLDGGLVRGLTTVGGLPGMGKTQLALQFGGNYAKRLRRKLIKSRGRRKTGIIPIISAEMTGVQLAHRLAQCETGIQTKKGMSPRDYKTLVKFMRYAQQLPLLVDDSDLLSTKIIFSRLESLFMQYGKIEEIIIDFAELISDVDDLSNDKVRQMGNVFIRSKILSKRYDCPVILLSHLSRSAEDSKSKVPSMSHLMWSRLAEAMSDMVTLIYNPYYYVKVGKTVPTPANMPPEPGTAYLIFDKNRWGETGVYPMGWEPSITKWSDSPKGGMYHKVDADEIFGFMS